MGIAEARRFSIELRSSVMKQHLDGYHPVVQRELVLRAAPVLRDAMICAHLVGLRQRPRSKTLRLSDGTTVYDAMLKSLRAGLDLTSSEEDTMVAEYSGYSLKVMGDVAAEVERKLQKTSAGLIEQGAHVSEGRAALKDQFDALGLTQKNGYQLETIFRTHTQLAYGAGRWQADQDPAVQEILWGYEYNAVLDDRTRPEHAALAGTRLPKDDEFWLTWWPPNGYNCRCVAIPIFNDEENLAEPYTPDGAYDVEPDPGFDFNAGLVFALSDWGWDGASHGWMYKHQDALELAYNPDQPRGPDGKFAGGGGGFKSRTTKEKHARLVAHITKQLGTGVGKFSQADLHKLAAVNHDGDSSTLYFPIKFNDAQKTALANAFPKMQLKTQNALKAIKNNPEIASAIAEQTGAKIVQSKEFPGEPKLVAKKLGKEKTATGLPVEANHNALVAMLPKFGNPNVAQDVAALNAKKGFPHGSEPGTMYLPKYMKHAYSSKQLLKNTFPNAVFKFKNQNLHFAKNPELAKVVEANKDAVKTATMTPEQKVTHEHEKIVTAANSVTLPDSEYRDGVALSKWWASANLAGKTYIKGFTNGKYPKIREMERQGVPNVFVRAMHTTLDAAPKFVGTIYRGQKMHTAEAIAFANKLVPGAQVHFNATSSASRLVNVARDYSNTGLLMRIESKTGVSVEGISHYKKEREVMIRHDAKFEVISVKENVHVNSKAGAMGYGSKVTKLVHLREI